MIKKKPKPTNLGIEIDLTGPQGNAFYLLGTASKLSKQLGMELFSTNQIRNNLYLYVELFSRFLNTPTALLFNNDLVYFGTEKDRTDPTFNPTELGIEKTMDVLMFDEFMQDKEQSMQIKKYLNIWPRRRNNYLGHPTQRTME